jgi:dipeptidase E
MEGLGLVDFVVLPHYGEEEDMVRYRSIFERYEDRYEILPLKDDQAVRVDPDGSHALVASP